jgi:hypothetical protein
MTNNLVQDLRIDESIHLGFSLLAGTVCFLIFDNFWLIPIALIVGFFIDIDHLFDYFNYFGRSGFKNLKNFFRVKTYFDSKGKAYMPLHAFEYLPLFWILGHLIGFEGLSWTLFLSYLFHLLWDNFSLRNHHPLAYFIIYRAVKGFDAGLFQHNDKK